MPMFQAFNGRNKSWVKYEFSKNGWKALDVKQRDPGTPFKGVPIRGKKK